MLYECFLPICWDTCPNTSVVQTKKSSYQLRDFEQLQHYWLLSNCFSKKLYQPTYSPTKYSCVSTSLPTRTIRCFHFYWSHWCELCSFSLDFHDYHRHRTFWHIFTDCSYFFSEFFATFLLIICPYLNSLLPLLTLFISVCRILYYSVYYFFYWERSLYKYLSDFALSL